MAPFSIPGGNDQCLGHHESGLRADHDEEHRGIHQPPFTEEEKEGSRKSHPALLRTAAESSPSTPTLTRVA